MSLVVRFNSLVVRKSAIVAKWDGGMESYRRDVLFHDAEALDLPDRLEQHLAHRFKAWYYEDLHLTVVVSMGGLDGYLACLQDHCLVSPADGASGDFVFGDQAKGVRQPCDWLKQAECCGFPVCWYSAHPESFVVDFKPADFVLAVSSEDCASCGRQFGMEAAFQANLSLPFGLC